MEEAQATLSRVASELAAQKQACRRHEKREKSMWQALYVSKADVDAAKFTPSSLSSSR